MSLPSQLPNCVALAESCATLAHCTHEMTQPLCGSTPCPALRCVLSHEMTHPCLAACLCASICDCFQLRSIASSPAQVDLVRDHVLKDRFAMVLSLESGQRSYSQVKLEFEILRERKLQALRLGFLGLLLFRASAASAIICASHHGVSLATYQ